MAKANSLEPLRGLLAGHRPPSSANPPYGFKALRLSKDEREFIESEALQTFTLAVNGGLTFQGALTAVLLTGMHLARVAKEKETGE